MVVPNDTIGDMRNVALTTFLALLVGCAEVASIGPGDSDKQTENDGVSEDPAANYRALFIENNLEAKAACHAAGEFWVELRKGSARHYLCAAGDEYLMTRLMALGLYPANSQCGGACSTYAFRLISGSVDNSEQSFLDDDQKGNGYFLADVGYATSDLVAERDVEGEL